MKKESLTPKQAENLVIANKIIAVMEKNAQMKERIIEMLLDRLPYEDQLTYKRDGYLKDINRLNMN